MKWIIEYREPTWLKSDTIFVGPFNTYDEAYEQLCVMPAPGHGGVKWITTLYAQWGGPWTMGEKEEGA